MRQILIFLMLITFSFCSEAQISTEYDTCTALQPIEGEWIYQNGQEQIKVYLRYHRSVMYATDLGSTSNSIKDELIGWIEYKVGSNIIESTYQNRFMTLNYDYSQIPYDSFSLRLNFKGFNVCSSNVLTGSIKDFGHSSQLKNVTAQLTNNNTMMHWSQVHSEGYGAFNGDYGMTLPREFILIKQ